MLTANSNPDPYKWVYEKPAEDCPFREDMTPSEIAEIISHRVIEVLKKQLQTKLQAHSPNNLAHARPGQLP